LWDARIAGTATSKLAGRGDHWQSCCNWAPGKRHRGGDRGLHQKERDI